MSDKFQTQSVEEILKDLNTSLSGITFQEAERRKEKFGLNELPQKPKVNPIKLFIKQYLNLISMILIVAASISFILHETTDAAAIMIIVVVNGLIGFWQELKAISAIESLSKYEVPHATVKRDNLKQEILAREIVIGDIVFLEGGDKVPADGRIVEMHNLRVDESILTGESESVVKRSRALSKEVTSLAEQENMVFRGTNIVDGTALFVVTSTGYSTQFGKIAETLVETKEIKSNLERKIEKLVVLLSIGAIFIIATTLIIGIFQGNELRDTFMIGVSLAVSAIPEGLAIITTITMALGIQRMAKKKALIRTLPSVETLSSVDVICTDKTGTLTEGTMSVRKVIGLKEDGRTVDIDEPTDDYKRIAVLCSEASMKSGSPTERALLNFASPNHDEINAIRKKYKRIAEIPFNSTRKYMLTLNERNENRYIFMKGATEKVLNLCTKYKSEEGVEELSEKLKKKILMESKEYGDLGYRVLSLAYRKNLKNNKNEIDLDKELPGDLIFVGIALIEDPPREDVKKAIDKCKKAGVKVIMLTGDQAETALAIGKQVGLVGDDDNNVLRGEEIKMMSNSGLKVHLKSTVVYARVDPKDKLRILEILQEEEYDVAMIGDGVNDSLALKKANIGIAVEDGTDISKEVSDIILLNNSFATIPNAIEEGRRIFSNIKKFLILLLSSNFDEVLVILASLLLKFPMPFLPIHILWLNLVTDGFPSIALTVDPPSADLMQRKPKSFKSLIRDILPFSIYAAIIDFIVDLLAFFIAWKIIGYSVIQAQTMALMTTVMFEFVLSYMVRINGLSIKKIFNNRFLNISVIITFSLQLLVLYTNIGQKLLKVYPISLTDWGIIFGLILVATGFVALGKKIGIHKH